MDGCGEKADWWGGEREAKTCRTHAKAKETRIDGAIVNGWMLPKVRSFKVE